MNNNKKTPNLIIPPELEGKTFLDPKYDTAFKLLFQEKELLIHFLNGVLHLNEQDKIKDIDYRAQENILGFTDAVTTVRFDLMAKTEKDEFIHIEIQKARHTFWKDRVLLYNAALMLQAKKDFHFHKSIYKLPKIISVWVCDFKQGEGSHFHEEWSLYRRSDLVKGGNAVPVTDLLSYIFLELPSFNKSLSELKSIEDKWLYLLNTAGDSVHSPVTDDVRIARAYAKLRVDRQSQEILL
ncbi:MAG: Rpn family recombination-promoting nuclease/putative transposase, partial [Fibrobacter sp.]|nr:Rpn family recombination-promoting nuclease/putative transposase [Fibrobacter sp.]